MLSNEEVDYEHYDDLADLEPDRGSERRRELSRAWSAAFESHRRTGVALEILAPQVQVKVEELDDEPQTERPPTPPLPADDRPPTPPLPQGPLVRRITTPSRQSPSTPFASPTPIDAPPTPALSDTSSSRPTEVQPQTPSPSEVRAEVTRMIDRIHTRDAAKARRQARVAAATGGQRRAGRGESGDAGQGQGQRQRRRTAPGRGAVETHRRHSAGGHGPAYDMRRLYIPAPPAHTAYPASHLLPHNHLPPLAASRDPNAHIPLQIRVEPSFLQFAPNLHAAANAAPLGEAEVEAKPSQAPDERLVNVALHTAHPLKVQLTVISSATLSSVHHELDLATATAREERAERERTVTMLHTLCHAEHADETTYGRMERIRAFARTELVAMGRLQQ